MTVIITDIPEQLIDVKNINAATYNPRVDLKKEDPEYKQIEGSLEDFGLVVPLVWNKRTKTLVSGHQRLKVLVSKGCKKVPCKVVDVDVITEKRMNIALNEVSGRRDSEAFAELLRELSNAEASLDNIGLTSDQIDDIIKEVTIDTDKRVKELDIKQVFDVVVECDDEETQEAVFERLTSEGYKCRVLTL